MQSSGVTAIKNLMSKLREQNKEQKTYELTVSYSCSGEQDPFKESLNQLLRINCNAVHLSEAFYRLPNPLTAEKIIGLATELENEFNKYGDDMFTEGYSDEGTTKVCFLIPCADKLEIKEVIDYPKKKTKKGK
jgi:hypothetical protein